MKGKDFMALENVGPDTHPTWLQRYMQGFRGEMHQAAEAARKETDPEKALAHVSELADHVEYLGSVVTALVNHVARQR